jgi:hypothetical protein
MPEAPSYRGMKAGHFSSGAHPSNKIIPNISAQPIMAFSRIYDTGIQITTQPIIFIYGSVISHKSCKVQPLVLPIRLV